MKLSSSIDLKLTDHLLQNFLNVKQYFKTLVRRKGSSNQVSVNVTFVHKKSQTFDEMDAKLIDDFSEVSFMSKKF